MLLRLGYLLMSFLCRTGKYAFNVATLAMLSCFVLCIYVCIHIVQSVHVIWLIDMSIRRDIGNTKSPHTSCATSDHESVTDVLLKELMLVDAELPSKLRKLPWTHAGEILQQNIVFPLPKTHNASCCF